MKKVFALKAYQAIQRRGLTGLLWGLAFMVPFSMGFAQENLDAPGVVASNPAGGVETLDQAMAQAYLCNPELEAARANLRQKDEGVHQAKNEWKPDITGSLSQTYQRNKPNNADRSVALQKSAGVTVTQNLFEGGATHHRTKAAETNVKAGRQGLLSAEQTTLFNTIQTFLDVYTKGKILVFLKASEKVLQSTLDETRARYEVGDVTRTDVAAVEANLAEAAARRVNAEGDLENARANFVKIVGHAPGRLRFPQPKLTLPGNRQQAVALALEKNPSLRAAKFDEEAAAHTKQVEFARLLPTVTATAEASRSFVAQDNGNGQKNLSVSVSVVVPIYQKGTTHSRIRSAEQQRAEIISRRKNTWREVVRVMTEAWTRLVSARKSKEQLELQVAANDLALRGVREEYGLGTKSLLDVLQIEEKWRDAQIRLAQAKQEEILATYGVLAVSGELTARSLKLNVPYYDPTAYYRKHEHTLVGLE